MNYNDGGQVHGSGDHNDGRERHDSRKSGSGGACRVKSTHSTFPNPKKVSGSNETASTTTEDVSQTDCWWYGKTWGRCEVVE